MSVYYYIAQARPIECNDFCVQQGMPDATSLDELASNLTNVVAQNGELAFKKIMELHPDKDVLLEMFSQKQQQPIKQFDSGITEVQPLELRQLQDEFKNASGTSDVAKNTNTYILLAAVIVSLAIISIK